MTTAMADKADTLTQDVQMAAIESGIMSPEDIQNAFEFGGRPGEYFSEHLMEATYKQIKTFLTLLAQNEKKTQNALLFLQQQQQERKAASRSASGSASGSSYRWAPAASSFYPSGAGAGAGATYGPSAFSPAQYK